MGVYMGIGIITKLAFDKSALIDIKSDINSIKEEISKKFNIDFDIYSVVESNSRYTFNIKDKVIEEQLKPFLNEIYPTLYSDTSFYENIIKKLDKLDADKIIEYAKNKSEEAFQYDSYGTEDYIYGSFGKTLAISYETILISMEGKISMECYGRHFNFFKNCIVKAYPQYNIANSLRVYITG